MTLQEVKDVIEEFYANDDRPPEDVVDDLVELQEYIGVLTEALEE